MRHSNVLATLLAALALFAPVPSYGQPSDLLLPPQAASAASRRDAPARRARKARVNLPALDSASVRLQLFTDAQPTLTRRRLERPAAGHVVWVGDDEYGAQAVLTVANGVLTGTVYADNRSFEITSDADGQYTVAELDPGSFPTDDPEFEGAQFEILQGPDAVAADVATAPLVSGSVESVAGDTTPVTIDVMVVWTPRATAAAGGTDAMTSLALNAVANANLAYSNSAVGARLRLVYSGEVAYTENPTSLSTDLGNLRGTTDGHIDGVHTTRNQVGADIVTLIGDGYRANGFCGIGGLMSTVSTSFASSAFNIVDRTCAVGNLTYAHEVGHNQGLHHDPSNASGTPSQTYAYGYQDPSGYFRTVLAYGSATRIPYLSSPLVTYNSRVTGTEAQDNARTLNTNAGTIAAFRSAADATTPTAPTTCTYSVSTTSLAFAATASTKSVTITAPSGCAWTTSNNGTSWVVVGPASGSGSASVTVSVQGNSGGARSTAVTVAGKQIAVTQSGVRVKNSKSAADRR